MSLEITDFLKPLNAIIEHDNQTLGQQFMQHRVLLWMVAHKDLLDPIVKEGLIECMEKVIEETKRERPKYGTFEQANVVSKGTE